MFDSKGFGAWLRAQRTARAMTVRAAHRSAGLSYSRWSALEAGGRVADGVWVDSNPTDVTLVKVARALDLPPSEVLAQADRVQTQAEIDSQWLQDKRQQLEQLLVDAENHPELGRVLREHLK